LSTPPPQGRLPAIGQHLFIGFIGPELTVETRRLLNAVRPGGVVLFARNIDGERELRSLTRALRTEFPFRPLIAIDQENGRVNRLRNIIGEVPTIADLKRDGAVAKAREFGRKTGRRLRRFQIDLDFAPVFDLELFGQEVDNALRERCWGRTAEEVIAWAGAFIEGLAREGVAACPKHFPGLGGAAQDSHEQLPTIHRSRRQLLTEDVQPYAKLLRHLPAIMVSHGHYPAFDGKKPLPATLSSAIMTGLLREKLRYRRLVLTDDMEMGAIAQFGSFEQAVVQSFRAGADMLLVCHIAEKALSAHEALTKAVESGTLSARRMQEARLRIQRFRKEWITPQG
jgi:beta-N-acetylhexosaminidase